MSENSTVTTNTETEDVPSTKARPPKVFCIGAGKTGTTSLESFFRSLGFRAGDQERGELLLRDWSVRNFEPVISLAKSADFFQDMPFNCPFTFQAMDMAFPNSKFILSVRDNADQWYASLIRFHTKSVGKGTLPSAEALKDFPYRYKGWIFEALKLVYGVSDREPYNKQTLIRAYEGHNAEVKRYFMYRPESLLIINVADATAAQKVIEFVGAPYRGERMPHLNRSSC